MGNDRLTLGAPARYKFTVEDFLALDRSGIFQDKGRFELIDGEIFAMAPQFARHSTTTRRIANAIEDAIERAGLGLSVFSQISVRADDVGMPEPDVVVADWSDDGAVPVGSVVLAIEVSDTSLAHDLKRKARLYAQGRVPEYWVVDLPNGQLHQMSDPTAKGYATVIVHAFGVSVASRALPEIILETARLA